MSEIASHWAKGFGRLSAAIDIACIDIDAFLVGWGAHLEPSARDYLTARVAEWRRIRAQAEQDVAQ